VQRVHQTRAAFEDGSLRCSSTLKVRRTHVAALDPVILGPVRTKCRVAREARRRVALRDDFGNRRWRAEANFLRIGCLEFSRQIEAIAGGGRSIVSQCQVAQHRFATGSASHTQWPNARRVILSSCVGTTLEFYDFFIYGPISALVFAKVFFPMQAEGTAALLSLGTFAVGFLARPLGAVLGGHAGDRWGRKTPMLAGVVAMGLSTFAIGCLPTYASIGIWAPVLLVMLRFLQGVAVGSEWGGAASMLVEHAPPARRAFYSSLMHTAPPAGTILSSGVVAILATTLSSEEMLAWGWRIPFLLSIFVAMFGIYLRLIVEETPEFLRIEAEKKQSSGPVTEVIRRRPLRLLAAMGAHMGDAGNGYVLVIFGLGYATRHIGLSSQTILTATVVASSMSLIAVPFVGALCNRFGPDRLIAAGGLALMIWGYPMFWLLHTGSVAIVFVVFGVGLLITCVIATPMAAFYTELFEPRVRCSGMSLGFQGGTVLGGGLGPLVAQALQNGAGGEVWPVSLYLVALGAIVILSVAIARQQRGTTA